MESNDLLSSGEPVLTVSNGVNGSDVQGQSIRHQTVLSGSPVCQLHYLASPDSFVLKESVRLLQTNPATNQSKTSSLLRPYKERGRVTYLDIKLDRKV